MHAHRVMAVHIQTMSLQFFDLQTDTKTDTLAKRKEQYCVPLSQVTYK